MSVLPMPDRRCHPRSVLHFSERPSRISGRQVVAHDDPFTGVNEGKRHVAADVTGATGD
jgi:hypothetical protein